MMVAFQTWCWDVCGLAFKAAKDRVAAQSQLALGFWWNSRTLTRTLEERKMLQYVDMIATFASREKLTLVEMQCAAGRLQRCIMTFPPGAACLLVSLFTLMCGLKLPWHARRTTRRVRKDLGLILQLLQLNMGKGYYSYSGFTRGHVGFTDASKKFRFAGAGWVSKCGCYNFWTYGSRAMRQLIDFFEGDAVVVYAQQMGAKWFKKVQPVGIDSKAFEQSAEKGRSRAERLNELIRKLFFLQLRYTFIFEYFWLCSADKFWQTIYPVIEKLIF